MFWLPLCQSWRGLKATRSSYSSSVDQQNHSSFKQDTPIQRWEAGYTTAANKNLISTKDFLQTWAYLRRSKRIPKVAEERKTKTVVTDPTKTRKDSGTRPRISSMSAIAELTMRTMLDEKAGFVTPPSSGPQGRIFLERYCNQERA